MGVVARECAARRACPLRKQRALAVSRFSGSDRLCLMQICLILSTLHDLLSALANFEGLHQLQLNSNSSCLSCSCLTQSFKKMSALAICIKHIYTPHDLASNLAPSASLQILLLLSAAEFLPTRNKQQ